MSSRMPKISLNMTQISPNMTHISSNMDKMSPNITKYNTYHQIWLKYWHVDNIWAIFESYLMIYVIFSDFCSSFGDTWTIICDILPMISDFWAISGDIWVIFDDILSIYGPQLVKAIYLVLLWSNLVTLGSYFMMFEPYHFI